MFASGAASLIFEVVWSRLLRLVFGSTTLAVSTILVAYMLGLGLGGLVGARVAKRVRDGVRAYGLIEIGTGLYALLVPSALQILPAVNFALVGSLSAWPAALCRFALVLALLLAPTLAMGATLPLLTQAVVRREGEASRQVALLYGVNTLGAVAGTLGATFVLFSALGVRATNLTAVLLDLAVGAAAVGFLAPYLERRRRAGSEPADVERPRAEAAVPSPSRWNAPLLAYATVGFTSLTYEVCWTRALSMILGSSVYAFATMLASFLAGIALGSLAARPWVERLRDPGRAYALAIALLGALSLGTITAFRFLPSVFVDVVQAFGTSPAGITATSLTIGALAMLGPTLVLGALFPLLVRTQTARPDDAAGAVGAAYFANTIGSASGAFAAGFVLIPGFGLQRTMAIAVALNFACSGLLLLRPATGRAPRRAVAGAAAIAIGLLVLLRPPTWSPDQLTRGVFNNPGIAEDALATGTPLLGVPREGLLMYSEGMNATVSVHRVDDVIVLRVNGKTDASTSADMGTQVLLGHLGFLFGGAHERVLVVGLASAVTVGSAALHGAGAIEVVELEPAIVEASHFFDAYNNRPLENPAVQLRIDDGRSVIATSRAKYDLIISEPSNPWITGAANLFTREYFAAARAALRPGGQLLQWMQSYSMPPESMRAVIASLRAEFPYVYGFARSESSGDLLLLARQEPLRAEELPYWERQPEAVRQDLLRIGLFSTADLWTLLCLGPDDVSTLAEGAARLNTDDDMLVELTAPWALDQFDLLRANTALLDSVEHGVLPVLAAAHVDLTAEEIGALALAYLDTHANAELATMTLIAAKMWEPSADAQVTEAALQAALDGTPESPDLLGKIAAGFPTSFTPRLRRAVLLHRVGRADEALVEADAALALRADDPRARLQRVLLLNELQRGSEGAADAEVLVHSGFAQFDSAVWLEAAQSAAAAGDLPAAISRLRLYALGHPWNPVVWYGLAGYLRLAGRETEAEEATENQQRCERERAARRGLPAPAAP